jgi:uncharacterized delta-60 repeat protein
MPEFGGAMKPGNLQLKFSVFPKVSPTKSHCALRGKSLRRVLVILGVLGLALMTLPPAWAASGALDPTFKPGLGVAPVPMLWGRTNYSDSSGKMLITGSFTKIGVYARSGIARLNADGGLDTSFDAPVSGWVNSAILLNPGLPDSQILISSDGLSIPSDSGTYYGLARLNADGKADASFFHTFTSAEGVMSAALQADGKIIVAGYAMSVNGYPGQTFYLLRLNADGTVDTSYPMRSAPGAYVAGVWADQNAPGQARLFGTIPRFSDPTHVDHMLLLSADGNTVKEGIGDETVNGPILFMTWQGSNTVIVGPFTKVKGVSMNGIARLLPNGTLDPSFTVGTGANGQVKRVWTDGTKLVLNGYFTSFNGTPCGHMVRLNYNGSVDGTFGIGTGADDRIWNAIKMNDTTWTVMGAFQSFNGSPRNCLASLSSEGVLNSQFASFTPGYSGSPTVYAMQFSPSGLYIGSNTSGYGGKLHRRVARALYPGGAPDASWRAGMASGPGNGVGGIYSMSGQGDGKLVVGGNFGFGGCYVGCTSLARLLPADGAMDLDFNPVLAKTDGSIPNIYMVQVSWDGSGHILVGGDFAKIADADHVMQSRTGIARLNSDGTLDATFTFNPASMPGLTNIVILGASDDTGGPISVFGKATYNGNTCGFIARLLHNGSLDTSFGISQGPVSHVVLFNGQVKGAQGDETTGRITVVGEFGKILDGGNNPNRNRIARFSPAGILDLSFAPQGPDGPIYAVVGQYFTDKLFIGGAFTMYNGVARHNIARLKVDGSLDTSFDPGTGADGAVNVMMYNPQNQKLLIGGSFTTYNGVSRPRIAQIVAAGGSVIPALYELLTQ